MVANQERGMCARESPLGAAGTASPALQAALERIDREFGIAAYHRSRKRRVRRLLAAGPVDDEVVLRHGWLAQAVHERGLDLAGALIVLERCRHANARHDRAVRLWACSFRLLDRDTIFALRLTLRLLRRHAPHRFAQIVEIMAPQRRSAAE
jgi:hypothetical protein